MTHVIEKLTATKSLITGFALIALLSLINSVILLAGAIPCYFGFGQPELPQSILNKIEENENK